MRSGNGVLASLLAGEVVPCVTAKTLSFISATKS